MIRIRSSSGILPLAAALLVAAVVGACGAPKTPSVPGLSLPDRVQVRTGGRVVSVPLEEYVLGSAIAEVSPTDQSADTVARVFEVQAILARTYAAAGIGRHQADGFDLCDTTHCQVYDPARLKTSRFAGAARAAVERTAGEVITYGKRPVEALYHADCGGYTASAETVWGGRGAPYLLPEPDKLPSDPHRKWRVSIGADKLRTAFNADDASAVGRRLDDIRVVSRDVSGRVVTASLTGEHPHTLRGEQLRAIINASLGGSILSTRLSITRSGGSYVFEGTGYGHGVGLCQVGAAARAKRGDSVEQIIGHYFPGATIGAAR